MAHTFDYKPATEAELRALPGMSDDVLAVCLRAHCSLEDAVETLLRHQQEQLAEQQAERDRVAKQRGNTKAERGETGVLELFAREFKRLLDEGLPAPEAMRRVHELFPTTKPAISR